MSETSGSTVPAAAVESDSGTTVPAAPHGAVVETSPVEPVDSDAAADADAQPKSGTVTVAVAGLTDRLIVPIGDTTIEVTAGGTEVPAHALDAVYAAAQANDVSLHQPGS